MKKLTILLLTVFIVAATKVKADEGMWLLPLLSKLNIDKMQELGLKLSAEDIYSVNNSSLKDAIVIFGGYCTGEIISDKGLILTNHHCGYGAIQELSSIENNYLKDGFWAKNFEEELPVEGLFVTFLKKMEDVTPKVLEGVSVDLTEEERFKIINKNIDAIKDAAGENNDYLISVKSFFENNQYFLMVYEKFTDVRFVGAPPSSIGKFGYDTDNWMWPRHTGDFSMFRVYADKDGKPAKYSKDNVPLKPKHHLPVSLKGVEKDDFAMTVGYPGGTDRYLTSWGIKERMEIINDSRITPRAVKQDIWQKDMLADEKINIQYASKFSVSSNYWKNSIGMNRGLKKLNVLDSKRKLENEFKSWVSKSATRKKTYGDVLNSLEKLYSERAEHLKAQLYLNECMLRGTEIISFGIKSVPLEKALKDDNTDDIKKISNSILKKLDGMYKDYSSKTDEKVFAALLKVYTEQIDSKFHPSFYKDIVEKKYKNDYAKFARDAFKKSIFTSKDKYKAFLENPKLKTLQNDLVFQIANSTRNVYKQTSDKINNTKLDDKKYNRLFIAGLKEMYPNKVFYPDANFTMRLSYGKVGNYEPKDAVIYKHYTTLTGIMEKEDPNNFEFIVPVKLKELYNEKDYGNYAAEDGTLRVCFTTDNDITGGNSGSPVINANGELFGLAFDGNWEAMSGDIAFETELQKCINVDIRYVLFIIDKFAGAQNLIDEMTIVN